ncbi:hypothetical protein SERLA73DRAFT_75568 [Serpula lacrymans var. lacrymans S7.3]|uniref:CCHC-type domain-containing protein n=2 Tax=Serpula lacrymans var. lacrymans TaxID=341189 RepID=F8Q567_SERL3|nr:uncharacterized protein SERLADRAFT_440329 [Serpula lacrymans var. lacrymans S7.9]EGN96694.1 hypothetical protein SERLA73DRAFT_75568 [Serpula lacrymans var. lacrymans S7.3]EGO22311.1 hypothetical protein SERLADRAFT_440329 [Serpula lacrymans var. lacrymans S7.9]
MRTDDFVTWFLALSIQGGLGNEHAVELLERNVSPAIAQQLYIQDMRSENLSQAAEEVHKIGRAIKVYKMQFGGGPTTKNNSSQRSPGSSKQNSHHSHGFKPFGLQPGQGAPMDIGTVQGGQMCRFKGNCYNCGQEGHMSQDYDWLNTLASHSYDEIRAFFYDQQVAEMKAQGKEFGA